MIRILFCKSNIPEIFFLLFCSFLFFSHAANAATNIDSTFRWAWNEAIGWIDFYSTDNVIVSATSVQGYASSSVGFIALNCESSQNGNICATSNFKVVNDGNGNLAGYAWSPAIGWISFSCDQTPVGGSNNCASSNYRVTIDQNGYFHGYAWSEVVGWISFNCLEPNICATSDYKVKTSWSGQQYLTSGVMESAIFDTQKIGGVVYNFIMWRGTLGSNTSVDLQIASSNSVSGPWTFVGPDCTSSTFYRDNPGIQQRISPRCHTGHRYFRYKIYLNSTDGQNSPVVEDVIVGWSP
jgi:hypothetical protein